MNKRKLVLANNPLLSGPSFQERDRTGSPYREIPIADIERDPKQPRTTFDEAKLVELAESIKAYGVLSPILVRPTEVPGKYLLVSGERRLRASQLAGKTTVPSIVSQLDHNEGDFTLAVQLVENLQRSDLTPLERAQAIGVLKETYKLSVRDIGSKLGISKSMVQRSLEILELPDDLLNALKQGAAESKVLLLAKIEDADIRASYLKDLDVLTRNALEVNIEKESSKSKTDSRMSPEDSRVAEEIQRALGLKAKISRSSPVAESGKIVLEFYSDTDLQEVFRRLVNG